MDAEVWDDEKHTLVPMYDKKYKGIKVTYAFSENSSREKTYWAYTENSPYFCISRPYANRNELVGESQFLIDSYLEEKNK